LFTSISFIVFFLILFIIYYSIPDKWKKFCLLIVSYAFCAYIMPAAVLWLAVTTVMTYIGGILLSNNHKKISKKVFGVALIFLLILMLFIGKYSMYLQSLVMEREPAFQLVTPIGISFYVLQEVAYLIDVYRRNILVERNLGILALYISFFPKLVSGPIEKADGFLKQLQDEFIKPGYEELRYGILIICWGYFEKIVIADHAAIIVNIIFDGYQNFIGITLIKGALLYGVQLYADFDGYTNIARGCAELLGYHLKRNFNQPYFAVSVQDFWRRWHISLSEWLKEYVYIPLGGSRCSTFRHYINLMLTFLISGLWHGAGMKYLLWGALHGIYQITGKITLPVRIHLCKTLKVRTECISFRIFQSIVTFIFIDFAWIFFRANSIRSGILYIAVLIKTFSFADIVSTSIYSLDSNSVAITTMLWGIVALLAVDILHECHISIIGIMEKQNCVFRYCMYVVIILVILCAEVQTIGQDISAFIYAQF